MKGVRRRGDAYFVDFYSNDRRIRKVVGKNRKMAEAILHKYKAEVVEGKFLDGNPLAIVQLARNNNKMRE